METLTTLLSIDLNYVIIALLVIFYRLEQTLNTPFKFSNRPRHLLHNLLFQAVNPFIAIRRIKADQP